jgi:hypothetical protein
MINGSIVAIVSEDLHLSALRVAEKLGEQGLLSARLLNAPLDDETSSWITRIWDSVESALNTAYHSGIEEARFHISEAAEEISELGSSLKRRANEVRAAIAAKLDAYLQAVIDGALRRVRSSVNIGGRTLELSKVSIEQKVTFSGSLKASLEEICEFVAEGELSLSAEYGSA